MKLQPVNLLVLLTAALIEGQQPGWYKVTKYKHWTSNYSQNPKQDGWTSETRPVVQKSDDIQQVHALEHMDAPAEFLPHMFAQKIDGKPLLLPLHSSVSVPLQNSVQTEVWSPVLSPSPEQKEGWHPYQSPVRTRTYPVQTVGQLPSYPQSPSQNDVPRPVLVPAHSAAQFVGHLPTSRQIPPQTDVPRPVLVPAQSPVQFVGKLSTSQQSPPQTDVPRHFLLAPQSPAEFVGQLHTSRQNPPLTDDPRPVLVPAQSAAQFVRHLPPSRQSPPQTDVPRPVLVPAHSAAQFVGHLPTSRQSPPQTDVPRPVLVPAHSAAQFVGHLPTSRQSPPQTDVPRPVLVPAQSPVQFVGKLSTSQQSLPQTEVPRHFLLAPQSPAEFVGQLHTSRQNPPQTDVQRPVLVPAQSPVQFVGKLSTSQQSPPQTDVSRPVLVPAHSVAQFVGHLSTSRQSPPQTDVSRPVLVPPQSPAEFVGQLHTSRLGPPQTDVPRPFLVPAQHPAQSPMQSARGLALVQEQTAVEDSLQTQDRFPPLKKLTWRYPQIPERPKQPPIQFDLQQPVPASSVVAACGENMAHVEVKQDLFGNGNLITPTALTLGGCALAGQDSAAHVLLFESELHSCGSILLMTEDELVYRFTLVYQPTPFAGTPIVRTTAASIFVECHYPRKHNVSSNVVQPMWVPYASTLVAEESLVLALKLMNDDWTYERPSNKYYLGDLMNIQASLVQFNHAPLRVYVDNCVAIPGLDVKAVPRYSFIENHGCLVDGKITGSSSRFMPRVQDDKLQIQLEVFKFDQDNSSLIYITCSLKATAAIYPSDNEHKSCSFTANRWIAADGDDQVCSCCDANCSARRERSMSSEEDLYFEGTVSLDPVLVEERTVFR